MSLADNIAAAQNWWREAGVDQHFVDDAQCLLAEVGPERTDKVDTPVKVTARETVLPPLPQLGGDRSNWPAELPAFRNWWLEEPSLGESGSFPRIAPAGNAGAKLLVLVSMPEMEDRDTLLAGACGRLVANMTRAMGFTGDELYLASALPRHTPMPDWQSLAKSGLGALIDHHIGLARPERCIVMGRDLHAIVSDGEVCPVFLTYSPESLLANARLRAELWRHWLDWEHSPK